MILSFGDKRTGDIFNGVSTSKTRRVPPELLEAAARKLDLINSAVLIDDLKIPPGNKLEKLKGDLKEFYSIRVNDQFRIIFKFENGSADKVEFLDYHKG